MNWFGGILTIVYTDDRREIVHDLSFTKAQEYIDNLPKGSVKSAFYTPYATTMEQAA